MENSQYCRLCLNSSVIYQSLLKNNGTQMLQLLTGIQIVENSTSSTDACVKCWLNLKLAYGVQQHIIEADKRLNQALINGVQIPIEMETKKIEPTDLIDDDHKFELADVTIADNIQLLELKAEKLDADPVVDDKINEIDNAIDYQSNNIENEPPQTHQSDDEKEYPEVIYIQADNIDNNEGNVVCPICGKNCIENTLYYEHINVHYNEPITCDRCSGSLANIAEYRNHMQLIHPDIEIKKTNLCGICQLSFLYKPLYDIHLATVHSNTAKLRRKKKYDVKIKNFDESDNDLKCDACNKVLRNRAAYRTHVKGHTKRPCPQCGVYITTYNLNKHIALHRSGPAVCHLCGTTSKNLESLRGHMYYTHSQKRLTCEECGRIFKKLYSYNMHIKKEHTGERTFTCDTCGKRFFTNYEMNTHIKSTHLKERNHICKFCNRGFSSRFSMKTHERQHTNEAPYICELCGQGFRQNVSLRAHRKSRHNIIESKETECPICRKMFINEWALKSHTRSVHD